MRQLDYIKQEHHIFSTYFKASFPENANEITSSLVCDEDFIHVYSFTQWDGHWPMIGHTYSKHGDISFYSRASDTVSAMRNHLEVRGASCIHDSYNSHSEGKLEC